MLDKITISFGTLDDIDRIAPLFDSYRQFYGESSQLELSKKFLRKRLLFGESNLILAKNEKEVIGFIQLYPSFSSVTLQRLWIVNDLYVDENNRHLGTGSKLLKAAKNFAIKAGAKELFIEGAVKNIVACNLYENIGFIPNIDYNYYHLPLSSS